ncbi:MAG: hypothetical protein QF793_01050 [Candidatus Peribacteraceae bacterium]|jgi:hypothetical protein|nr:hypothetical protein [bacterium]MDP6561492.1 hypothetical protein [Candidatus Peribacteraceae bacterium]|tara:strand:- start:21893 stop:22864 length:972 start_codon:yes stop_codon:yes gene_type:complete
MQFIVSLIFLLVPHTFAGEVPVQLLGEDIAIEEIVSSAASHAKADLKGKGSLMKLSYSTIEPLSVFVMFQETDGSFDTFETLRTVLPAGTMQEATVDLTQSPGWSTGIRRYRLYFFSSAPAGAEFHDVTFEAASIGSIISAALNHLINTQPYSPASYHRLPGYSILSIPLVPIVGLLMVLIVVLLILKKNRNLIIPLIVVIVLISHARFSVDALRYSWKHVGEWMGNGTYATAGALPSIAERLREEEAQRIYLCHSGTTYAVKLLQYHTYPGLISNQDPSHIVVHKSTDWSIDGERLRCGEDQFSVTLMEEYKDGSALYLRNI